VWINKEFIVEFVKHTDIIIFTNQGKYSPELLKKILLFIEDIGDFTIFISTDKDSDYHKPHVGMYELFIELTGKHIEYFVGDACGRPNDHSPSDAYFAFNIGIPIKTPEEFYYTQMVNTLPKMSMVIDLYNYIKVYPDPIDIRSKISSLSRFVIFGIGFPASGKTTYFKEHFPDIIRISQDDLKTKAKTIAMVKKCLAKGESFIIDKIFGTIADREEYLSLIRDASHVPDQVLYQNVPKQGGHGGQLSPKHVPHLIGIFFNTPMFVCRHLNAYRSIVLREAPYINSIVYKTYNKNFQAPTFKEFDMLYELKLNIPIIGKYITSAQKDEVEELKTGRHSRRILHDSSSN